MEHGFNPNNPSPYGRLNSNPSKLVRLAPQHGRSHHSRQKPQLTSLRTNAELSVLLPHRTHQHKNPSNLGRKEEEESNTHRVRYFATVSFITSVAVGRPSVRRQSSHSQKDSSFLLFRPVAVVRSVRPCSTSINIAGRLFSSVRRRKKCTRFRLKTVCKIIQHQRELSIPPRGVVGDRGI